MTLYIGENLKKQRKLRELTQEQLADILGVSFQAVSKWERGEGYPDIELLPTIAEYFGITTDELMGIKEIRDSADVKKILDKAKENMSKGLIEENIKLLAEAVKIHPNNYKLLARYALNLTFVSIDSESEESRRNNLKAVEIAERILAECTDPEIRNIMQGELCIYYRNLGEDDKALEAAGKLPTMWKSREVIQMNILKGDDLVKHTQSNIYQLTNIMFLCLQTMADINEKNNPKLTCEQRIEILRKAIAIFDIVYDKGDYITMAHNISVLHRDIAEVSMRAGNFELALESLEKSAEYAAYMDELPDKMSHVSLLVNTLEYNSAQIGKNFSNPFSERLLMKMSDSRYDEIRDDPRFKAVESSLKEHI
ncbi:MAG: helix-turn-helix domain-containing protein [Oscillospiraceae bacterium]|nr:helix-turn-helix domain-containing protein [Oscillospiraceae bacterium]